MLSEIVPFVTTTTTTKEFRIFCCLQPELAVINKSISNLATSEGKEEGVHGQN